MHTRTVTLRYPHVHSHSPIHTTTHSPKQTTPLSSALRLSHPATPPPRNPQSYNYTQLYSVVQDWAARPAPWYQHVHRPRPGRAARLRAVNCYRDDASVGVPHFLDLAIVERGWGCAAPIVVGLAYPIGRGVVRTNSRGRPSNIIGTGIGVGGGGGRCQGLVADAAAACVLACDIFLRPGCHGRTEITEGFDGMVIGRNAR